ncbi:hypothetical protein JKP88DRAFT_215414 [Tribonema minus]|uniref:Membrane magnesium transporter n=1 Tax=Tribonema minus TaxID=303371 RepID=A0A836CBS2_9STRA|nr:hypothetical protein JKP88DRAFT_215414 [Tribonema minus]
MVKLGTIVAGLGLLVLLHAGYSAAHYRQFIVAAEGEAAPAEDAPPLDAVVETIVGFLLCVAGVVSAAGQMLPVRGPAGGGRSADAHEGLPGFAVFSHRAVQLRRRTQALIAAKK